MAEPVFFSVLPSPIGRLLLTSNGEAVTGLYMEQHQRGPSPQPTWREDDAPLRAAREQLEEYFAGGRTRFDLPLAPRGTAFQRAVWEALLRIPFGVTTTYQELARGLGMPRAARAVGAANGRNPVSIIVPCHRVVGADGSLTGYAGGEERKRWLLDHERSRASANLSDKQTGWDRPAAAPRQVG